MLNLVVLSVLALWQGAQARSPVAGAMMCSRAEALRLASSTRSAEWIADAAVNACRPGLDERFAARQARRWSDSAVEDRERNTNATLRTALIARMRGIALETVRRERAGS